MGEVLSVVPSDFSLPGVADLDQVLIEVRVVIVVNEFGEDVSGCPATDVIDHRPTSIVCGHIAHDRPTSDVVGTGLGFCVSLKDILAIIPFLIFELVLLAAVDLEMMLLKVVIGVLVNSGLHIGQLVQAPAR